MMSAGEVASSLARSQGHLSSVLKQWDAADPAGCEHIRESLRGAIAELDGVRRGLAGGAHSSTPAQVLALEKIRSQAARLARLVDAAHAFYRGMDLCAADSSDRGGRSGGLGEA